MGEVFIPRKISKFRRLRHFRTPSGNMVVLLPGCSFSAKHLVPENWGRASKVGRTRQVRKVALLSNGDAIRDRRGSPAAIYSKSPERALRFKYAGDSSPSGAYPFGSHSGREEIRGAPAVENQVRWEARILLALASLGIPAERPQAIIIRPNGEKEIVTKEIGPQEANPVKRGYRPIGAGDFRRLAEAGIIPRDEGTHNRVRGKNAEHFIDVNRWGWTSPRAKVFERKILLAIEKALGKRLDWSENRDNRHS